jgi:hypothetical protein
MDLRLMIAEIQNAAVCSTVKRRGWGDYNVVNKLLDERLEEVFKRRILGLQMLTPERTNFESRRRRITRDDAHSHTRGLVDTFAIEV